MSTTPATSFCSPNSPTTPRSQAYATHPEHLRVREALGDLRIGRFQVDYPIKETGA